MTKQQLNEYRWIQKNIRALNETLEELRGKAEPQSPTMTDEPRSTIERFDKIPELVVLINETEAMLIEKIKEAHVALEVIEETINNLPERERCLMRLRYICCKSWEEICIEMDYARQHVHRIHKKTLELIK